MSVEGEVISKKIYDSLPPCIKAKIWLGLGYILESEIRQLKTFVPISRNSIDVGANKGVYSYFISRCSNHVYAYEPNPSLLPVLMCNSRDNITLRQVGLSNKPGNLPFQIPLDEMGRECTNLSKIVEEGTSSESIPMKRINIEVKRLDDEQLQDIGFIKIDVEGHEKEVILGGQKLIAQDKPIILVEIEQRHIKCKIEEVFETIISLGYVGHFFYGGRLIDIDEFSYPRHQEPMVKSLESGTFQLRNHQFYGNNFLFRPL